MTETAKKSQDLLDTKFGTVAPAAIEDDTSKAGKPMATATMVTTGGKEVKIFAHGEKRIAELKAKAEAGEPFVVTGTLLAKGAAISASKFEPTTYTGKIEITKEGANDSGPWAAVKMKVEGKDRAIAILVTGDEVERVKAAGDAEISIDAVWKVSRRDDGNWGSSALSVNSLQRAPAAPKPEEAEAPGM